MPPPTFGVLGGGCEGWEALIRASKSKGRVFIIERCDVMWLWQELWGLTGFFLFLWAVGSPCPDASPFFGLANPPSFSALVIFRKAPWQGCSLSVPVCGAEKNTLGNRRSNEMKSIKIVLPSVSPDHLHLRFRCFLNCLSFGVHHHHHHSTGARAHRQNYLSPQAWNF